MKILILEYITGGGMRQEPVPASLAEEGGRMLKALMDDLLTIPGLGLMVLQDGRRPLPRHGPRVQILGVSADADFEALWLDSIKACDAVWPIAPETGGILEQLCRDVENAGKALLTCPAAAVSLATSKLAAARRLALHGLTVMPTVPLEEWRSHAYPVVIKPDDGVGCEGVRIIQDVTEFETLNQTENWIAQPLLEGESLSLSALFAQGQARLLSMNRQRIEQTGAGFALTGCQVNALDDADGQWQNLAGQIAQAIPELWGYAGIDLILGEDGPVILEINPRLTTSYAGLRLATGENPAAMVLDLWKTGALPAPRREPGQPVEILLEKPDGH